MATVTWSTTDLSPGGAWSFSGDFLTATEATASSSGIRTNSGVSTGKWYWEVVPSIASGTLDAFIGLLPSTATAIQISTAAVGYSIRANGALIGFSTGFSYVSGDVLGFALDVDAGKMWARKNGGAWAGGGDPAAGTSPSASGLAASTTWLPAAGSDNNATNHVFVLHGTPATFANSAPSGFVPLSVTYTISGVVTAGDGGFAALVVNAHLRTTGAFVSGATCSGVDGTYSILVAGTDEHYVVALDSGSNNALVLDRIVPIVS